MKSSSEITVRNESVYLLTEH